MRRNLIYHCYPKNNWEEITTKLLQFDIGIFNGVKVATVPCGPKPSQEDLNALMGHYQDTAIYRQTNSLLSVASDVSESNFYACKSKLLSMGFDEVIQVENGPGMEHHGLRPAMEIVKDHGGITFRAHTKGVTGKIPEQQNKKWRWAIWNSLLSNIDVVDEAIQNDKKFVGCLLVNNYDTVLREWRTVTTGVSRWPEWYYAGSHYWMSDEIVEQFVDYRVPIPPCPWSVEYFPCYFGPQEIGMNIGPKWAQLSLADNIVGKEMQFFNNCLVSSNFDLFGSDKNELHSYGDFYNKLFANKNISSVLEIGVLEGASLRAFSMAGKRPVVFGIDDNAESINIIKSRGPQYTEAVEFFRTNKMKFDLVVDDASHSLEDQISGFEKFEHLLSDSGTYVVEDLQSEKAIKYFRDNGWSIVDLRSVKNRYDDVIAYKENK